MVIRGRSGGHHWTSRMRTHPGSCYCYSHPPAAAMTPVTRTMGVPAIAIVVIVFGRPGGGTPMYTSRSRSPARSARGLLTAPGKMSRPRPSMHGSRPGRIELITAGTETLTHLSAEEPRLLRPLLRERHHNLPSAPGQRPRQRARQRERAYLAPLVRIALDPAPERVDLVVHQMCDLLVVHSWLCTSLGFSPWLYCYSFGVGDRP